jgi:DNA-binding beta-propeller fold protein YncE
MRRFWGVALLAAVALLAWPASPAGAATSCCAPWGPPSQVVLSPDGRFAYTDSISATLVLARDSETGALTALESYGVGGGAMALSPDGSTLYVAGINDATIVALSRDSETGLLSVVGTWKGPDAGGPYAGLEPSRDGRQLYASDFRRDAVVTLDRDPASGAVSFHGEIRSGDPGVSDLRAPSALAVSSDDRFLYVGSRGTGAALTFERADDGGLTFLGGNVGCYCGSGDLALSPDGTKLFGGLLDLFALDREPGSGQLGDFVSMPRNPVGVVSTTDSILPIPDGSGIWIAEPWAGQLREVKPGPSGFTTTRTYREGVDGAGWYEPGGLVLSPDGRNVYVPSMVLPDEGKSGRIAVFKRDPSTNELTFASLFEAPVSGGPEGSLPSMAINDGEKFTNDPDVEIKVSGVDHYAAVGGILVSNENGFGESAQHYDYIDNEEPYPWTLSTDDPGQPTKTVFVLVSRPRGAVVTSDEIVLDQRAPALGAARLIPSKRSRAARIRVQARDGVSGLGQMRVTRHRGAPGPWRPFKRVTPVPHGHGAIWVRVRDRAGNRSPWMRAAR